ncbi:MAG: nitroreductase family protein, partial [Bacteroidales bacterium]
MAKAIGKRYPEKFYMEKTGVTMANEKIQDFRGLVMQRQSVRKYSGQTVAREKIQKCIEAARLAPSACNAQPWKFIVIDDPDV